MNFYKLAQIDGYDFYTGKTINYRDNIGKTVTCPNYNQRGELCTDSFIHASREPNQCFIGAKIPCSAYLVSGRPIKEDKNKCGFKNLRVIEELKPAELFKWRYEEVCHPMNPINIHAPKITEKHKILLKACISVRASVRASVGDSFRDSVWDSVWASVGASVGDSVWDSVWDSVGTSVGASVGTSFWAYIGYIFQPVIPKWKEKYPYQCYIDLWEEGFIPIFANNKTYLWSKDRVLEEVK